MWIWDACRLKSIILSEGTLNSFPQLANLFCGDDVVISCLVHAGSKFMSDMRIAQDMPGDDSNESCDGALTLFVYDWQVFLAYPTHRLGHPSPDNTCFKKPVSVV